MHQPVKDKTSLRHIWLQVYIINRGGVEGVSHEQAIVRANEAVKAATASTTTVLSRKDK